ncbi:permease [Deinococcus sp. RL]|uniref:AI-2E family transporter n=1 Tax=Deinococcus sp. RL TaxID=1489678 RepID=UPI0004D8B17A
MTRSSVPRAALQVTNLLPTALTVVAVLLLLSFFGRVAAPLLAITLAVILATALNPAVRVLERWLPRGVATLLTVGAALAAVGAAVWLALPPIAAQVVDLARSLPTDLSELERRAESALVRYPQLAPLLREDVLAELGNRAAGWATGAAGSVLGLGLSLVGGLFTALLTLVMVIFVLSHPAPLIRGVLGAVPPRFRVQATAALAQILGEMGAWGRATLLIMLMMGTATAIGLSLLGVANPLVFGLIAALGELVPNIGPIVAVIPPILFALADDPQKALYVALFSLVIQQIESYVLAPFLLGGAAKLHPLSVTVGVLLFGSVFGLVGAFLTVPFLIIIRAVYNHFYLRERPDVSDAVALALIGGQLTEQLAADQDAAAEAEERREAERRERAERGDLPLEEALGASKEPPRS